MKKISVFILAFILAGADVLITVGTAQNSQQVIVKHYTQEVWIVKAGETLTEIVTMLEPHDEYQRQRLTTFILQNNSNAFINNNPDAMLAGARLKLPSLTKQSYTK